MYTAYFGFREKPFNLTPDPRFFYENPVYREAYANLLYGIRERKGFSVLIGEVGTGKTTLLLRLMDQLGGSVRFAFVYNTRLSFDELLSFMCEEFLLSVNDKSRLEKIQALNEFLIGRLRDRSTAVLLIDEAQNLDQEALENLRLLSNLETRNEKLLQIVLVGQPELLQKLDDPGLRQVKQRIAVWIRLSRLKEKEVGDFIRHRLQTVGYKKKELFTARAIRQIVLLTQGIPRLINIVCDNALVIAYAKSKKKVSPEIIQEVASDLRLVSGTPYEVGEEEEGGWTFGDRGWSGAERSEYRRPGSTVGRWARVGLETFLGVLLLAGLLSFISPLEIQAVIPDLYIKAGRTLDAVRDTIKTLQANLQLADNEKSGGKNWLKGSKNSFDTEARAEAPLKAAPALADRTRPEEPSPQQSIPRDRGESIAAPPTDVVATNPDQNDARAQGPQAKWIVQPIVIERTTSIGRLVRKIYGNDNTLAIDLADEYNPHIGNLDRLRAGDKLWLPPLSREILLRRQPDGTYNFVLASFRSSLAADRFAKRVERRGFVVVIKPKKVFGDRSLHRVEIVGLRDLKAAEQTWQLAKTNRWLELDGRLAAKELTRVKNR